MIDILKKIWNFFTTLQPVEYTCSDGKKIYIIHGGEAVSTIIVEGAGVIDIPNHRPKSLDN